MIYLLIYTCIGIVVNMLSLFIMVAKGEGCERGWAMKHLLKGLIGSMILWPYLVYRDWND